MNAAGLFRGGAGEKQPGISQADLIRILGHGAGDDDKHKAAKPGGSLQSKAFSLDPSIRNTAEGFNEENNICSTLTAIIDHIIRYCASNRCRRGTFRRDVRARRSKYLDSSHYTWHL